VGDEEGDWITVKGVHILIEPGETAGEAFKRTTGREVGSAGKSKSQKTPAPKSTKTPSGSKERLKEHVSDFSKKYAKEKIEHLHAYKDGKVVAERHGTARNVEFPVKEAKDADIVHNHPKNVCFSPADINLSMTYDVRSMTAVTKDGKTYTVTRPEDGWKPRHRSSVKFDWQDSQREVNKSDEFKKILADVKSKSMTHAAANRKYTDMIARKAITKMGLILEET